jgi:hypothetical protein
MLEDKSLNPNPQRHSALGIASFVISLISIASFFIIVIFAAVLATQNPGILTTGEPSDSITIVIGLLVLLSLFLSLIGVGLGIAGVLIKNRKKIFAILGLIFNIIFITCMIGLMIIGASQQ